MNACLQRVSGTDSITNKTISSASPPSLGPQRLPANYYSTPDDLDLFPNPSLLDFSDEIQEEDVTIPVNIMLDNALNDGFRNNYRHELENLVHEYLNVFRTTFSSVSPADVPPLRLELTPAAIPTGVKPRK